MCVCFLRRKSSRNLFNISSLRPFSLVPSFRRPPRLLSQVVKVPQEIVDDVLDIHDFSINVLDYGTDMLRGLVLTMLQEHQV